MSNKLENIRFLVTKEILGQLSEEEKGELMNQIAMDETAKETRDEMLATAQETNIVEYINTPQTISPADLIIGKIHARRRQRIIYIRSLAAAVVLIFFVGGYFALNRSEIFPQNPGSPNLVSVNKSAVRLQLSTGQIINILNDTSQVISGNRVIKVEKKILSFSNGNSKNDEFATLTVPSGMDYTVHLSDGSIVQLNSSSSVRFPMDFKGDTREISITGEAYLRVAFNSRLPFIVHLSNETVQVLGTEFNVNSYDSGIARISLVKGRVKVKSKNDSIELKPGQEAISLQNTLTTEAFDEYETLSWMRGVYMFNNAKLDEVCKVVDRWFGVNLVIDKRSLLDKRFTGKIDKNLPLENLLKGLQSTNEIKYYLDEEGNYHIK